MSAGREIGSTDPTGRNSGHDHFDAWLAESATISFGWGNATVFLQTKKIKGLHENDFIMATKIDRIFARTATA